MVVCGPPSPALYVGSSSPTLTRQFSAHSESSHALYSLLPVALRASRASADCACMSPPIAISSPSSSALSIACCICALTDSSMAACRAFGLPRLVGTYALTTISSVPSARMRTLARCSRPGTSTSMPVSSTVAVFHHIKMPANVSSSGAGDVATLHPENSPHVSACVTRELSPSGSRTGRCVSWRRTMSLLAARVCIVLQSRASASQDNADVSWLSDAVAILRTPGIAAVASRSRMTIPPWLSVTMWA